MSATENTAKITEEHLLSILTRDRLEHKSSELWKSWHDWYGLRAKGIEFNNKINSFMESFQDFFIIGKRDNPNEPCTGVLENYILKFDNYSKFLNSMGTWFDNKVTYNKKGIIDWVKDNGEELMEGAKRIEDGTISVDIDIPFLSVAKPDEAIVVSNGNLEQYMVYMDCWTKDERKRKEVVSLYIQQIDDIRKKTDVNRLFFVEKIKGPHGAIAIREEIGNYYSDISTHVFYQKNIANPLDADTLSLFKDLTRKPDTTENFVILYDLGYSRKGIAEVAKKIEELSGDTMRFEGAVYLYDYQRRPKFYEKKNSKVYDEMGRKAHIIFDKCNKAVEEAAWKYYANNNVLDDNYPAYFLKALTISAATFLTLGNTKATKKAIKWVDRYMRGV